MAIAPILAIVVLVSSADSAAQCTPGAAVVDLDGLPASVAGYDQEQLGNAAIIMQTAEGRGLDQRAQVIGVAAAMGESSLRNIDFGDDVLNPDGSMSCSLGLFQQQWCLGWGTREQVLDPAYAAGAFFDRLIAVSGWETMQATIAINRVQSNADPYHYAPFEAAANEVVAALSGVPVGEGHCAPVTADGWTLPADGPITSPYGMRVDPVTGAFTKLHAGTDFGGHCGDPLYAAANGSVTRVFQDSFGAWIIEIDHGGGIQSWTVHMEADGVLVDEGDVVAAGDRIGLMGSSGWSTGCHLHFEIHTDGTPTDAAAFLAAQGVTLPN